jgi:hypothetical protein
MAKRKSTRRQTTSRKSTKRELIDPKRGGKRFVRRGNSGKFQESDQVSRSLRRDRKTAAKRKTKSGQGDKGDRKR